MYRLIALDVDGTLLDSRHHLAPETRIAIQEAQRRGASVCLATGKLLVSTSDLVASLNLSGPQITCNGAAIMDARTGVNVASWALGALVNQLAIATIRELAPEMAIAWYTADAIYTDADTGSLDAVLAAYHEPPLNHVLRLSPDLPPAMKLLMTGDTARLADLRDQLADRLGAVANVMRTTADFVEIVSSAVNKGVALREVARMMRISREEIVAIGDGENDIPLLEAAGLGIAMGNAMPALVPYARAITSSANDLGVVHALSALGLSSAGDADRLRWR
jgi:Cof subfamily protein (haloacid dehalogenase superfamily)